MQLTNYPGNYVRMNQYNVDNPRTLAHTNKYDLIENCIILHFYSILFTVFRKSFFSFEILIGYLKICTFSRISLKALKIYNFNLFSLILDK